MSPETVFEASRVVGQMFEMLAVMGLEQSRHTKKVERGDKYSR
jgi:hypothetical protein